jgi:cell division transport system ATP-binding protein
VIEFDDVDFSYGRTPVLRKTTLALEPGSFHFLIGPSGAGKTTLIRLCHLELAPTAGRIRFFGRTIGRRDRNAIAVLRRRVGVVPQQCHFLEHLRLIDNIALPLRVSGVPTVERTDDLRALLDWVDLGDRADALPAELSVGERLRAALARAVILSPELILADEPSGGVDREAARQLLGLLIELNRMGKTVLVATHDPDLPPAAWGRVPAQVLGLSGGRVELAEAAA